MAHFICQSFASKYKSLSVLHQLPPVSALSYSMAAFSVAGKVELHGNSATLTLQLPQGEPELKIYRPKSDALIADIEAGKIQVHPSRQPIDKKKLSNAMNNVQRMLLLKGGAEGEWNPRAQVRLESLLAKPLLIKNMKGAQLAIEDGKPKEENGQSAKGGQLAIEDGKPQEEDGKPDASSDSSSDSDSSSNSNSSDADVPMAETEKDKKIAKLQEDFDSIFTALHHTQHDLSSAQKELMEAKTVIAEQHNEISNLKRTIQALQDQILSESDMMSMSD